MTTLFTCMTRAEWVRKLLRDQHFINPQHDARESKRIVAAACRVAGISGVAPLPRYTYTARGKATHTPDLAMAGLCPSKQASVDPRDKGTMDMSKVSRYANHYKGERFAQSALRANANNPHHPLSPAWMRSQFPWLPCDKAGSLMPGRVNSKGQRYFDMGGTRYTSLALYTAWAANEGAEQVEQRKAREASQLQALIAEQASDMARQRKGRA